MQFRLYRLILIALARSILMSLWHRRRYIYFVLGRDKITPTMDVGVVRNNCRSQSICTALKYTSQASQGQNVND